MNRRTFLKLSAWSGAWLSFISVGVDPGEAQAQTTFTAYGAGVYGAGIYPGFSEEFEPQPISTEDSEEEVEPQPISTGNSEEKVYLPIITN